MCDQSSGNDHQGEREERKLEGVETAVKSSVETNLKEQFRSYSDAVEKNGIVCPTEGLTDPATLKKLVKSVVHEEETSLSLGCQRTRTKVLWSRCRRYFRSYDWSLHFRQAWFFLWSCKDIGEIN